MGQTTIKNTLTSHSPGINLEVLTKIFRERAWSWQTLAMQTKYSKIFPFLSMLQNTKIVRGKHMTVPGVVIFYGKNVTFVKSSSWTALETLCRPSFEELALGRNGLEKGRKNVLDISCTLWRWFLKPRDLKKIDHNCKILSTRFYRFNSRQYVTLYTKYIFLTCG